MISDKDSGLDVAFSMIKNSDDQNFKEKIAELNHLVFIWHKMKNFFKQLVR